MPAVFARDLCGYRTHGKPNTSDASDQFSVDLGQALFDALGVAEDATGVEPTGAAFAQRIADDLQVKARQAGSPLLVLAERPLNAFEQYTHVAALRQVASGTSKEYAAAWKNLARFTRSLVASDDTQRARLDGLLSDVEAVVAIDTEARRLLVEQAGEESLLKLDVTAGLPSVGKPILQVGLSLKWSLRTDRAQDCRSQGANVGSKARPHAALRRSDDGTPALHAQPSRRGFWGCGLRLPPRPACPHEGRRGRVWKPPPAPTRPADLPPASGTKAVAGLRRTCRLHGLLSVTTARNDSWASSRGNRRSIQGNKGRDTRPELAVRRALHARGHRYRVDTRPEPSLNRRADIVVTRAKVAVFIDGCYWHDCPQHYTAPATNETYCATKVAANRERDVKTTRLFQSGGWTVVRVWEHEPVESAVLEVEAALLQRKPSGCHWDTRRHFAQERPVQSEANS